MSARDSTISKALGSDLLERIVRALDGLRFGSLELVVHEFKVVRITRTEKVRLEQPDKQPT